MWTIGGSRLGSDVLCRLMPTFLKIILGLAVAIVAAIVGLRLVYARRAQKLRDAIRRYVEARGGQIQFDGDNFTVRGPLGSGRETTTVLSIMCKPGEEDRWETSIGFVLRQYIPDAVHEAMAATAAQRLTELGPQIAALPDDELRAKLRATIVRASRDRKGLATCSRPVGEAFEVRVIVDGFALDGLPSDVRQRLPESDAELLARALDASLADEHPAVELGSGASPTWLARPEALWGSAAHVIVASGEDLVWTPVEPSNVEARLVMLANKSCESGPMKKVLWAWDGQTLSHSTVLVHTIIGTNTPDYTLSLPPAMHGVLGIHPGPDGTFGVSRR
jgi:hypothetical protein